MSLPTIAITMGDAAGVGPEIVDEGARRFLWCARCATRWSSAMLRDLRRAGEARQGARSR